MARDDGSAGEGAALDFSGHTYEELRTAILAADADAIRVGANEWADLRRRLNDRIGTLRLMIHKLEPDWDSGAGRTALSALRSHLDRMDALAKAARWNEDRFDALHETYHKAIKEFKELDASPGGQAEVVRNPGSDEPLPPNLADRRQPKAAQLAQDIYSQMALTSATLTIPGGLSGHPGEPPGDGTAAPEGNGGPGYGPGAGSRGGSTPQGSNTGWGAPGVIAPPPSKAGGPESSWSRPPAATRPAGGTTPGQAPAARSNPNTRAGGFAVTPGARSGPSVTGTGGFGSGGGPSVSRGVIGAPGSGVGSSSAPPPGGGNGPKVIGGGPRPTIGPGAEPPPSGGKPGHPGAMPPGAHGGAGGPGRGRPGQRTNYERGEPDTFRDTRHRAKPVFGQPSNPAKPVTAGPGVIGQQKQKPADTDRREQWQQPQPAPSPEGFPDKLEDGSFTRRDGARFTVRRRGSGA